MSSSSSARIFLPPSLSTRTTSEQERPLLLPQGSQSQDDLRDYNVEGDQPSSNLSTDSLSSLHRATTTASTLAPSPKTRRRGPPRSYSSIGNNDGDGHVDDGLSSYDDGEYATSLGSKHPNHRIPSDKSVDSRSSSSSDHEDDTDGNTTTMSVVTMVCILSTAFSYGCIMTTLFLITLPLECERIHADHPTQISKSVALGIFVSIAGITQLVSPIIGLWSDHYQPPSLEYELGQRLPYLVLGSTCTIVGLLGQYIASSSGFWMKYSVAFFLHMIGLNIMYAMMIALLPDQIPTTQIGMANGILALQLVLGSLFGFSLFHSILYQHIQNMYGLYVCLVIASSILTGLYAHETDVAITYQRIVTQQQQQQQRKSRHSQRSQHQQVATVPSQSATTLLYTASSSALPPSSAITAATTAAVPPQASSSLSSPSSPRQRRQRRQQHLQRAKWHKAARHVAHRAGHVLVLTPSLILKSIVLDPVQEMDWKTIQSSYWIDTTLYHDFAVVTLSRLFYYCGMSVQTFFLYYIQDVIGMHVNPQNVVATLAMITQVSGAMTCYPVGYISDHYCANFSCVEDCCYCCNCWSWWCWCGHNRQRQQRRARHPHSRRTPFVYLACVILSTFTLLLIFVRTLPHMKICCIVLGAANGMYLTMDTSLAVDTLPKTKLTSTRSSLSSSSSHQTNGSSHDDGSTSSDRVDEEDEDGSSQGSESGRSAKTSGNAQLLGVWGVAAFLGATLGPMISGPLLYLVGYQEPVFVDASDHPSSNKAGSIMSDEQYSLAGYAVVLSLSSLYFLLSAYTLRYLRQPEEDENADRSNYGEPSLDSR